MTDSPHDGAALLSIGDACGRHERCLATDPAPGARTRARARVGSLPAFHAVVLAQAWEVFVHGLVEQLGDFFGLEVVVNLVEMCSSERRPACVFPHRALLVSVPTCARAGPGAHARQAARAGLIFGAGAGARLA